MGHSQQEFESIMQELDKELGNRGVSVLCRPLLAAARYPCANKVIGNVEPNPQMGPYEGPNLIGNIEKWYLLHFPVQVVLPDGFHMRIILLRGEPFRLRIPSVFNAFGKLDVFDHIEDVSPALLNLLDHEQRAVLQMKFETFYRETSKILLCQQLAGSGKKSLLSDLLRTGWADLKSCGQGFNPQDPGASLFPAQQATEKYLKAYLSSQDEAVTKEELQKKYGHQIEKIVSACATYSVEFEQVIPLSERLSYSQEVRYKRPEYTLPDILDRIDLSHAICNLVSCLLIREQRAT